MGQRCVGYWHDRRGSVKQPPHFCLPSTTNTFRSQGRYTRVLDAHSAVGLPALASNDSTATSPSVVAGSSSSSSPVEESTSNTVEAASSSYPTAASTSPSPSSSAATAQTTKITDLRPRVLSRLTGQHRTCCFYGYKWCCYAQGCLKYTQCGHDLRVHFRQAHPGQAASFNFARLVHRTEQEAKAWAEGEEMDVDE
jgi:hypothetical protein